ncbi:MAG: DUF1854 domain-containing protein [Candidatus Latescibacteria bacterium]|nr:DUF1854 domain-containing protein [Candidatus Latescibacterota bacterium]
MPSDITNELSPLSPSDIHLYFDDFDDLTLELKGETHTQLQAQRSFPLNAPTKFIALQDSDGKEIGIVQDMADLDSDSRKALQIALEQAYFMPCITRINNITSKYHVPTWHVETDHGPCAFEIPSSKRDVRVIGETRVLLRDADGNRYEIPDFHRLDPESIAFVETIV